MRLRRTGAKKQPHYRVVIAESRAPRDGAFVDSIGFYDPLTEPATIRIDRDKALDWISKGAQPSETVVRLLRRSGIVEAGPETLPSTESKAASPARAASTRKSAPEEKAPSEASATPEAAATESADGNASSAE